MRMRILGLCLVSLGLAVSPSKAGGRDLSLVSGARNVEIVDAAKNNRGVAALRALLEQGADVNAADADGTTALHWASYWDDVESADLLIRAGADVNAQNDLGVTPLWPASLNGRADMVGRLLEAGANPNAALLRGETVLMTAARSGSADVVEQLLAKGADPNAITIRNQTALMWAVAQKHSDVVDVLLRHGAFVHARSESWTQVVRSETSSTSHEDFTSDMQEGGYTPLLFAARVGDLASAEFLVAAGADVNDAAPYGTSALVVAAHSGHPKLVEFLLEEGADPNAALAGYTALHAAILRQDKRAARALIVHGADPNAPVMRHTPARRNSELDFYIHPAFVGATPFWLAARMNQQAETMRLLAEYGADPRFVHYVEYWALAGGYQMYRQTHGATTALMAVLEMGGRGRVGYEQHSRYSTIGRSEREALILESVKVAIELGVDVNAANADGTTALHTARSQGWDRVVQYLIESGARLDVPERR